MVEEWGPWIAHDGSGLPVQVGVIVHRVFNRPTWKEEIGPHEVYIEYTGPVVAREAGNWTRGAEIVQVVRYRIRKPKALIKLIEMVENPPETVDV